MSGRPCSPPWPWKLQETSTVVLPSTKPGLPREPGPDPVPVKTLASRQPEPTATRTDRRKNVTQEIPFILAYRVGPCPLFLGLSQSPWPLLPAVHRASRSRTGGDSTASSQQSSGAGPGGGGAMPEALNTSEYAALTGDIEIDGSSTVFPITEAVAEEFGYLTEGNVRVHRGRFRHGRRLQEVLQWRDPDLRCLPPHQGQRGPALRRCRHRVYRDSRGPLTA